MIHTACDITQPHPVPQDANEIRARVKLAGEQQLAQKEEGTNGNQSNTSQPLNEPSDSTATA